MSAAAMQARHAVEGLRRGLLTAKDACGICLASGYTMADAVTLLGVEHEAVSDVLIQHLRERYVSGELSLPEFEALVARVV